eukprot:572894-Pyramimonas_sp.AAC.1
MHHPFMTLKNIIAGALRPTPTFTLQLKGFNDMFSRGFAWGTVRSGADRLAKVGERCSSFWKAQFNASMEYVSGLACEEDLEKQGFLHD